MQAFLRSAQEWRNGAFGQARKSLAAFRRQADLVYVYGSDDAWEAQTIIQAALEPETNTTYHYVQRPGLNIGLEKFRVVFCREASATPRVGC